MTTPEVELGIYPASVKKLTSVARKWLDETPVRKHGAALVLLLLVTVAAVLYFRRDAPADVFPFDDSYITLRYAHNVATHGKFAFDVDQPESGSGATSPLHVVLLALAIRLAGSALTEVEASQVLGVLFHFSLASATYWLGLAMFKRTGPALVGAFLTAVTGYTIYDSLNGMETTLFLTLNVVVAAHLLGDPEGRRPLVTGGLMTLAVLARPEGVFLAIAVGLFEAQRRYRKRAPFWPHFGLLYLPVVAGGLLLALFSYVTAGTPVPGTGLAKLQYFRDHELPLGDKLRLARGAVYAFYKPLSVFVLLALVSGLRPAFRFPALYLAIFLIIYLLLFPGGLDHYWHRYQHFVLPFLMLYAASGLFMAARLSMRVPVDFRMLILAALIAAFGYGIVSHHAFMRARYREDLNFSQTVRLPVAEWLKANTPEDAIIATHDVGILGYYSGRQILDLVGLTNREVLSYHSTRSVKAYLLETRPDYLVVLPNHDRLFLKIRPVNDPENFRLLKEFEPVRTGHRFRVYELKPGRS